MERLRVTIFSLLFLYIVQYGSCYHDPTSENAPYHCWYKNASRTNSNPVPCHGILVRWMEEPPSEIGVGQKFNVSYHVAFSVNESIYYDSLFGFESSGFNMTAQELHDFCHTSLCPPERAVIGESFKRECCVWHANIHVCHPGQCGKPEEICGPWVNNDQVQSTHTVAVYGNIDDTFSAELQIDIPKINYMIAHVKLGDMQMAVQKIIVVNEYFCGDGRCSSEESCDSCSVDCCSGVPAYAIGIGAGVGGVLVAVVILIIVLIVVWVYYQKRKLFYDESWIIDYAEIKQIGHGAGILGSMVSIQDDDKNSVGVSGAARKQMFTETGIYEGKNIAIKRISGHQKSDFQLTKAVRKEVMQIRVLDHANVCKFIGATLRSPGNHTIITEYCPKGSLNDVLQNEDIPLNWGFRFSFATDIARGMSYLHSKRLYHSRLQSTNCVIDDRWVVKITDYGIPSLRVRDDDSEIEEGVTRTQCLLYLSPEDKNNKIPSPTQYSNVYSFSIILLEIATRMDPYSEELFFDSNGSPRLPDLTQHECPCPEKFADLIKKCWDVSPTNRPSFDQIKKQIHRMNPNHESPVDMMMIMMEKYSKHLEALVGERTQELIVEQKKTQQLLYSMLPKAVADELRQGRPTSAQQFPSVTIYFSDIVGFTTLAGDSSPMEVVGLLNALYSTFDDILDTFDVYKVETIGDAYMVVSGVPKVNGERHAGEIARMALKLLAATDTFIIPHRPTTKLKIRVGIHSGPVCAGVVGLKMPRYCLFGDTVNTASRMESNSEAMRIHCSESTSQLLKKEGGFRLECRGTLSIKGKGLMTTWWLLGLDSDPSNNNSRSSTSSLVKRVSLQYNEDNDSGRGTLHPPPPTLNLPGAPS